LALGKEKPNVNCSPFSLVALAWALVIHTRGARVDRKASGLHSQEAGAQLALQELGLSQPIGFAVHERRKAQQRQPMWFKIKNT
jgi:hypothetical protein